jgi:hypothetical protein
MDEPNLTRLQGWVAYSPRYRCDVHRIVPDGDPNGGLPIPTSNFYWCAIVYEALPLCMRLCHTLITIVFVCMIINWCIGVAFYINMCITHAKISIYFTPGNYLSRVSFFVNFHGNRSNQTEIPVELVGIRCKLSELVILNWNLNSSGIWRFPVESVQ